MKYHNKKVIYDGIKFDSKKECKRYRELKLMERAGLVSDINIQVPFVLQESFIRCDGKRVRSIKYVADFTYKDKEGKLHIEDAKGVKTQVYKLKKKLFEYKFKTMIEEI